MNRPDEKKNARPKDSSCGCGKNKKDKHANPARVMQETSREMNSDVLGSYTGTPAAGGEPVQDADDL